MKTNDIYDSLNMEIFDFLSNYQKLNRLIQAKTGLTISQMTILRYLQEKGPSRITTISSDLKMDPGNVSNICFRLQKAGLIERENLPDDRRVSIVFISETNTEHAAPFLSAAEDLYRFTTDPLPPDKAEAITNSLEMLNSYYESMFRKFREQVNEKSEN